MGMAPSFKGRLNIELQVAAGMTSSLWTPQAIRLGTWILTQSTKSACCLRDRVKEEPAPLAQLSKQGQNVLVSTPEEML